MQSRRAHWIPHNNQTFVPRDWIELDTEAIELDDVQSFRLGVAALDRERSNGSRTPLDELELWDFWTPHDLWSWVSSVLRRDRRTILVCHNLAYDLRVSRALWELPALGFELQRFAFDGPACWLSWRRERETLVMVDTMSWAPKALGELGSLVGLTKPDLPAWDDTDDAWLERCRADVKITAAVWRTAMGFVTREDLGNWKPTGAGQSFAAWRHRFMEHKVLASDDEEVRTLERRAGWAGRCEAWRWGELRGNWTEWDMTLAYARIGAECWVPTRFLGSLSAPPAPDDYHAALLVGTYETSHPTIPTGIVDNEGVEHPVWPIGKIPTTAWQHELFASFCTGPTHAAYLYETAPALRAFCTWLIGIVENPEADPIERVIAKHWCRAFIGRFGTRYPKWEPFGLAADVDVVLSDLIDGDTKALHRMLHLGKQLLVDTELVDGEHTLPAVMSWVMAECRVRLWNIMTVAGLENLAYVDTDSVIVSDEGSARLEQAGIPGLRVKGSWSQIEILGPRQLLLGGNLRAAGVPRGSVRVDERQWKGRVWSSLEGDLSARRADTVTLADRYVNLEGTDRRRRHLPGGATEAIRL